ncbi:unnamed protein product [Urochloa humidicola]
MCSIAPFLLPPRRAANDIYVEDVPATWGGYGYYEDVADIDASLWGIDAVVRPPNTANIPKASTDFLALSRRHGGHDTSFNALLCCIPSICIPSAGLMASIPMDDVTTPTTPVTVLAASSIYGNDERNTFTTSRAPLPKKKKKQCGAEYDADIDTTFRVMETDPAERPSPDYLNTTQERGMIMSDHAELVAEMHRFASHYDLTSGALHCAVSYVDCFLLKKNITGGDGQLRLLFATAKYEYRTTYRRINADVVIAYVGCSWRNVLEAERELAAVLGYRLSGPMVPHLWTTS